jgi:hypothetical protein
LPNLWTSRLPKSLHNRVPHVRREFGGFAAASDGQAGQIYSTTASGYSHEAWQGVAAVLRAMQKLPIGPEHEQLPPLTKDNVGTAADPYDLPTVYEDQFKKLWRSPADRLRACAGEVLQP